MILPPDALKNHTAILGKAGSGKTYAAKGIVEGLLDRKERVCIIDPTGVWWGLKSSSSGKTAGYPLVIFGGSHGDLQLSGTHGETIAETIGTSTTPAIIDTSQMRPGERCKFFTDFANTLLRANKGPIHLVIDEAHLFAPQGRVADPQSGAMLHAANNLVSLGRARGLRITMITQRPAKLHKDSLTQIETMIALRLIAPQDRNAVEEWIDDQADAEQGKEVIASLPTLKTGTGWVWAPELGILKKVTFPKISTFDSSRAPDEIENKKVKMSAIDLDKISDKLKSIAEESQSNDPVRLKKRIADLEKENRSKVNGEFFNSARLREEHEKGRQEGLRQGYERGCSEIKSNIKKDIPDLLKQILNVVPAIAAVSNRKVSTSIWVDEAKHISKKTIEAVRPVVKQMKEERKIVEFGGLPGPQRKIIRSLEFWHSIGHMEPSKEQVAMVAGYSPTSSSFTNPIGSLRTEGHIVYPRPGHVSLVKGNSQTDMSESEARDMFMSVLDGPKKKIIAAFMEKNMEELTREACAELSNYSATSSSFTNPVGSLCTLGILIKSGPGLLRLAKWAKEIL